MPLILTAHAGTSVMQPTPGSTLYVGGPFAGDVQRLNSAALSYLSPIKTHG